MTKLVQTSQPNFATPKEQGHYSEDEDDEKGFFSPSITAVDSFFEGGPLPGLAKLTQAATGLSVSPITFSEEFLVSSYAFGGHIDCHLDAVKPFS